MAPAPPRTGVERFGAALAALQEELDWPLLERRYCDGEAAGFFAPPQRAALLDASLRFAEDVAAALPAGCARRSLYVGAALAELAPILCEALVLGREVRWVDLPNPESAELARALRAVGERLGLALPLPEALAPDALEPASCGHLWLVSVLTDPEQFPALHDALYGRAGTPLATGRGDLGAERARAEALVRAALARLRPPALLATTDEELALVGPLCAEHALALEVPDRARLSPIVGDPVRLCRVAR